MIKEFSDADFVGFQLGVSRPRCARSREGGWRHRVARRAFLRRGAACPEENGGTIMTIGARAKVLPAARLRGRTPAAAAVAGRAPSARHSRSPRTISASCCEACQPIAVQSKRIKVWAPPASCAVTIAAHISPPNALFGAEIAHGPIENDSCAAQTCHWIATESHRYQTLTRSLRCCMTSYAPAQPIAPHCYMGLTLDGVRESRKFTMKTAIIGGNGGGGRFTR